jgi:hypothetical protein
VEDVIEIQRNEPKYNRTTLVVFRAGGHTLAVVTMMGAAVTVLFPSGAVLLIEGIQPVGVIFISVCNVVGKFTLFYGGLMFGVIERFSKWVAQNNRQPLTLNEGLQMGGITLITVPLVIDFSLGALFSIEQFQMQVANLTATNSTLLPQVFTSVANATMNPAVWGVLVGTTAVFNLIANIGVFLVAGAILNALKMEYESIIFDNSQTENELNRKLFRYQLGIWNGTLLFLIIGIWGDVPFISFTAVLYQYFWNAPLAVGYTMGVELFINMLILAFLCLVPLGKNVTQMAIDILRREYVWPNTPQLTINVLKTLISLGIASMGSLYMVFNAIYGNLELPTQVVTGILGALLEVGMLYQLCGLGEHGLKYLLSCGWQSKNEVEENDIEKGETKQESVVEAQVSLEKEWVDSTLVIKSSTLKQNLTDEPSSQENNKTVTWGKWFGSFFPCCDGRRGKSEKIISSIPTGPQISTVSYAS